MADVWINITGGTILLGILIFVLKMFFNSSNSRSKERSDQMQHAFEELQTGVNAELKAISEQVNSLNLGLNLMQQDISNNGKEVAEIKTEVRLIDKKVVEELSKQGSQINKNMTEIARQDERYKSCIARTKK